MNQIIKEHNVETGEIIEREMTPQEIIEWEESKKIAAKEATIKAELNEKKASILERLGLTEDEAKLLLS